MLYGTDHKEDARIDNAGRIVAIEISLKSPL